MNLTIETTQDEDNIILSFTSVPETFLLGRSVMAALENLTVLQRNGDRFISTDRLDMFGIPRGTVTTKKPVDFIINGIVELNSEDVGTKYYRVEVATSCKINNVNAILEYLYSMVDRQIHEIEIIKL